MTGPARSAPGGGGATVEIEGLARFRYTMKRAGADMADMKDANTRAASTVADAAVALAPRRSGDLAASMKPAHQVGRARVVSALAYAGAIHWGWPLRGIAPNRFLLDASRLTQPQWLEAYEHDLEQIVASVKGA